MITVGPGCIHIMASPSHGKFNPVEDAMRNLFQVLGNPGATSGAYLSGKRSK